MLTVSRAVVVKIAINKNAQQFAHLWKKLVIILKLGIADTEHKVYFNNVNARFKCPLPGKVEMSAFAVVILFLKLLKAAAAIAEEPLCCCSKIILQPLYAGR
jgi:hypothetical protein